MPPESIPYLRRHPPARLSGTLPIDAPPDESDIANAMDLLEIPVSNPEERDEDVWQKYGEAVFREALRRLNAVGEELEAWDVGEVWAFPRREMPRAD